MRSKLRRMPVNPSELALLKLLIRGFEPQHPAGQPRDCTALVYSNVIDRERLRETSIGR
jgi:hypothetical protein